MSFWVTLQDKNGEPVEAPTHSEGGTYAVGGIGEAMLNVTYNYSHYFYMFLDGKKGLRWLHGKKAGKTVQRLSDVVKRLGMDQDPDYWKSTEGNVGHALNTLLIWATMYPNAVWRVS